MITADASALQVFLGSLLCTTNGFVTAANIVSQFFFQLIVEQLHGLWSAPFRIIMSIILLYQQLGVSSLFGSLILFLLIPLQVWSFIMFFCLFLNCT